MAAKSGKNKAIAASVAPGPDGKDISTVGWQQWPHVEKGMYGLVYIVSMNRFGYYDDDEVLEYPKVRKRRKTSTNRSVSLSSDDDCIMGAVVYLGVPLMSQNVILPYEDLLQPVQDNDDVWSITDGSAVPGWIDWPQ